MTERKIKTVTLTLTHNCNLACSYCYEHNRSGQIMDFNTAKGIIDVELKNSKDFDGMEIDLFGGEPFLEFELIKKITEYICDIKGDKPVTVFATTNGTLVHGAVQEWLIEHKGCFVCGLSLDGTRDMHNINRSNSYDDIDYAFFQRHYPEQDVKMTVSIDTLPMLAQGVIDMHKKGFLVSCNLAYGIDWSDKRHIAILERELNTLIDFYIDNPDIEPCSMLEMGISNIGGYQGEAIRYCGAGLSMRSYDADGRGYPCQFFMPLSVGEEKAQRANELVFHESIIPQEELDEKCKGCVVSPSCPNCYGSNYASTGSIYCRDENMCKLTKMIIKARGYFRAKQWEAGQLPKDSADTIGILRAIAVIDEQLAI